MTIFRNDRVVWNVSSRTEWLARRQRNIGASDIAALFHAHKFTTAFQLWARHTGKIKFEDEDTLAMRRGRIFEPAVAEALREQHPAWVIVPACQYFELTDLRLGASPDFFAWPSKDHSERDEGRFIIQVKTVIPDVYEDEWTPAPPAAFLLQVQAEMMAAGVTRSMLAVMVMDGREYPVHEYEFRSDGEVHDQIAVALTRFWRCVAKGEEPKLHHPQDAWAIARLYDEPAEDVLALHGSADAVQTCQSYADVSKRLKQLEEAKDALGSKLKGMLRNHSRAECEGWVIDWPLVAEHVRPQVVVKAHRRLNVRKKRG
jgi:predicted phage-related endonuclease